MARPDAPEQLVILVRGPAEGQPKPLVEVGGKPFVSYLLWHARRYGFRRVLLLAGGRADRFAEEIGGLVEEAGLKISLLAPPTPLGTGGMLHFAVDQLDERFLLIKGEALFDFNWLDLVTLMEPGVEVAMALRNTPDGQVDGGVYLLTRQVARTAPEAGSFEQGVLSALAAAGKVRSKPQSGFFLDLSTPAGRKAAQTLAPQSLARAAVFFDRDGVLNEDHGYTHRVADFSWIPGAAAAVKAVNDKNLFAFLVTNQGGVGRGFYDDADVATVHQHLQTELRRIGAHMDDIRYCPHHPDAVTPELAKPCDWRKPGAGMLRDLAAHWPIRMSSSLIVGDKVSDMQAGAAVGVEGLMFPGGDLAAFLTPRLPGL